MKQNFYFNFINLCYLKEELIINYFQRYFSQFYLNDRFRFFFHFLILIFVDCFIYQLLLNLNLLFPQPSYFKFNSTLYFHISNFINYLHQYLITNFNFIFKFNLYFKYFNDYYHFL